MEKTGCAPQVLTRNRVLMRNQMAGSPAQFPALLPAQAGVDFFKRSVEPREAAFQIFRPPPALQKIAVPKLVGPRDNGRTHGTVLVSALCPDETLRRVDPYR